MRISGGSAYVRNIVFGVEDGLVATVGLLAGVSEGGATRGAIILAGVVLMFVEGISMGVGSLLAEHSAEEYQTRKEISLWTTLRFSVAMFIAYFIAGFVPLVPYLFLSGHRALIVSIIVALLFLFALGYVNGRIVKIPPVKQGIQMLLLGGAAVIVGVVIGNIFKGI